LGRCFCVDASSSHSQPITSSPISMQFSPLAGTCTPSPTTSTTSPPTRRSEHRRSQGGRRRVFFYCFLVFIIYSRCVYFLSCEFVSCACLGIYPHFM
jgi:hypothetical protein